ncbi:MAG: ImmA/IrrE family metallo-endopeptidase [Gemmatimonadales bacterium]|nr:ImmA/IrrE family metallo-endopeptidase [Gemmatimonadales bacterium]
MTHAVSTRALIDALVRSTGAIDEFTAIRIKAREAIERFRAAFGEPTMPFDVDALASLLGIHRSEDAPAHSRDAELVPTGDGRVTMRVNPDRPETRKRFSVAHEISHTFFPNYHAKKWCRTDARYRSRANPDDLLEMLCDVGASELVLPAPWFTEAARAVDTGLGLAELANTYLVSREATLRRFAETHPGGAAAIFLSWKLKPTQERTLGNPNQKALFGMDAAEMARRARRLRLDYSILSTSFTTAGAYLPADKSVENSGPLYAAASTGQPCEGTCSLDLGPAGGKYKVLAVPLWTPDQHLGPNGENAVGAIIMPLRAR